jgi:GNAT superfamily N-acetyltransferase
MRNRILEKLQRSLPSAPRALAHSRSPTGGGDLPIEAADDARLREILRQRIGEFNFGTTGIHAIWPLAFQVRDRSGGVVAGVSGWMWGGTCYVEFLWVSEALRGHGLGTRLMHEVEREARARQCHQIALETYSFQNPAFYEGLGFESTGVLPDYPRGHQMLHLRKHLDTA